MQFWFRGRDQAFLLFTDFAKSNIFQKRKVLSAFVDLRIAFDTVNHKFCLTNLSYMGLRGFKKVGSLISCKTGSNLFRCLLGNFQSLGQSTLGCHRAAFGSTTFSPLYDVLANYDHNSSQFYLLMIKVFLCLGMIMNNYIMALCESLKSKCGEKCFPFRKKGETGHNTREGTLRQN